MSEFVRALDTWLVNSDKTASTWGSLTCTPAEFAAKAKNVVSGIINARAQKNCDQHQPPPVVYLCMFPYLSVYAAHVDRIRNPFAKRTANAKRGESGPTWEAVRAIESAYDVMVAEYILKGRWHSAAHKWTLVCTLCNRLFTKHSTRAITEVCVLRIIGIPSDEAMQAFGSQIGEAWPVFVSYVQHMVMALVTRGDDYSTNDTSFNNVYTNAKHAAVVLVYGTSGDRLASEDYARAYVVTQMLTAMFGVTLVSDEPGNGEVLAKVLYGPIVDRHTHTVAPVLRVDDSLKCAGGSPGYAKDFVHMHDDGTVHTLRDFRRWKQSGGWFSSNRPLTFTASDVDIFESIMRAVIRVQFETDVANGGVSPLSAVELSKISMGKYGASGANFLDEIRNFNSATLANVTQEDAEDAMEAALSAADDSSALERAIAKQRAIMRWDVPDGYDSDDYDDFDYGADAFDSSTGAVEQKLKEAPPVPLAAPTSRVQPPNASNPVLPSVPAPPNSPLPSVPAPQTARRTQMQRPTQPPQNSIRPIAPAPPLRTTQTTRPQRPTPPSAPAPPLRTTQRPTPPSAPAPPLPTTRPPRAQQPTTPNPPTTPTPLSRPLAAPIAGTEMGAGAMYSGHLLGIRLSRRFIETIVSQPIDNVHAFVRVTKATGKYVANSKEATLMGNKDPRRLNRKTKQFEPWLSYYMNNRKTYGNAPESEAAFARRQQTWLSSTDSPSDIHAKLLTGLEILLEMLRFMLANPASSSGAAWKAVMTPRTVAEKRSFVDAARFISRLGNSDNLSLATALAHGSGAAFMEETAAHWETLRANSAASANAFARPNRVSACHVAHDDNAGITYDSSADESEYDETVECNAPNELFGDAAVDVAEALQSISSDASFEFAHCGNDCLGFMEEHIGGLVKQYPTRFVPMPVDDAVFHLRPLQDLINTPRTDVLSNAALFCMQNTMDTEKSNAEIGDVCALGWVVPNGLYARSEMAPHITTVPVLV